MASNTNAFLIKNSKGLERPLIPAQIFNNVTMRTSLNTFIHSNYILTHTFNLTEAFRLTEIHLQPPVITYNNNRSGG
jgi:hypothetical protein